MTQGNHDCYGPDGERGEPHWELGVFGSVSGLLSCWILVVVEGKGCWRTPVRGRSRAPCPALRYLVFSPFSMGERFEAE